MRIWDCLTAASCGNVRGLLETEAGGGSNGLDDLPPPPPGGGGGGVSGGRGFIETPGGTGGEGAGALACQRLLVEAGAFERFGYSEMAVACARSVLQVSTAFTIGVDKQRLRCWISSHRRPELSRDVEMFLALTGSLGKISVP